MIKRKTIDINKKYHLPSAINVIPHKGKFIIIAPECANYIVLENKDQLNFYRALNDSTLDEALKKSADTISIEDAKKVLVQLEAKKFENTFAEEVRGLFQLHLYITNACNLRCPHCYMFSGQKMHNELSFQEITSLLDSFKEHDGSFLILSGGEVTTRNDFPDIVKYASELGLNVNIMTNGTSWSVSMVEELSPYIDSVQISIDGYDERTNSKVRGKGNFKKSIQSIGLFLDYDVRVTIAMTPWYDEALSDNIDNYIQFRREMETKYAGKHLEIKFSGDLMSGRNLEVGEAIQKEYALIMNKIRYADHEKSMAENIFVFNQRRKEIKKNWCTYGHLTVSATGDVYFCGKITQCKPVTNLRECDLSKIMQLSDKARKISEVTNLHPCSSCDLRYICGGDCRIKYFDYFTDGKNMTNPSKPMNIERQCNVKTKEYWYDLMILSNERLFS